MSDPRFGTFRVRTRQCKICHEITQERAEEPLPSRLFGGKPLGKRLLPHRPCDHCGAEIVTMSTPPPQGYAWANGPPLGATMGRRWGKIEIRW